MNKPTLFQAEWVTPMRDIDSGRADDKYMEYVREKLHHQVGLAISEEYSKEEDGFICLSGLRHDSRRDGVEYLGKFTRFRFDAIASLVEENRQLKYKIEMLEIVQRETKK